jgi:hypothetical protein
VRGKLKLPGVRAGGQGPPSLRASRREVGLGRVARWWPRSCAECGEGGELHCALAKDWEPGFLAAPVPRRCGPPICSLGPLPRQACLPHIAARVARTRGTRRMLCPLSSSVPAPQQKPGLRSLALFFSEPRAAPAARSQSKERKKKRGGGGAAGSSVLPVLWEDSSAATGGEGLRAPGGRGPWLSAGSARTAPRAGLGGGCCTAEGEPGRGPAGCTTSGRG